MVDQQIAASVREEMEENKRGDRIKGLLKARFAGWVLGPIIAVIFFPTTLLLFFCMMPTLVAYVVDRFPEKYGARTVAYMNLAGAFAPGWHLWTNDNSVPGAVSVISNLPLMVFVYFCALLGWGLYWLVPRVVLTYLKVALEVRLRAAKLQRLELASNWGETIGENAYDVMHQTQNDSALGDKAKKGGVFSRLMFWNRIMDRAKQETEEAIRLSRLENDTKLQQLQSHKDTAKGNQTDDNVAELTQDIDITDSVVSQEQSQEERIRMAQLAEDQEELALSQDQRN